MPLLAISGGNVAAAFQFDASAAIGLAVAITVIGLLSGRCLGRSPAGTAAAALLCLTSAALGCAADWVTFLALWQLQWFLAWSIGLFLGDDEVQAWLGRMLVAGWVVDAILIAVAVAVARPPADAGGVPLQSVLWGLAISLAGRLGALPIGAHRLWGDHAPRSAISWMLLACLPPSCVAGLRIIEALAVDPASRLGIGEFLLIAAMAAALCSLRQESLAREQAWRLSAALCGAAAIAVALPLWPGRLIWILAAVVAVVGSMRLSEATSLQRRFAPPTNLLGRLESAAAEEWKIPSLWRFGVAMPLRGASQVLRFVDGILFEQLPAQAGRRISKAASPALQVVPDTVRGYVAPALVAAVMVVLLVGSFR